MDHSISVDVSFAAVWSVLIVLTVLHASIRLLKWRQGLEVRVLSKRTVFALVLMRQLIRFVSAVS